MKYKDVLKSWLTWFRAWNYKVISQVLALIISVFSLYYAHEANLISENNRTDIRELNKLNIMPIIDLRLHLDSSNKTPPYIEITNSGPIDIIQLEIKLIELRYSTKKEKIHLAGSGSDVNWKFTSLNVNQSRQIEIPSPWFEYNYYEKLSKLNNEPIENIVIEAYISFRREPNLKLYERRAFYFLDSDGKIKNEKNIYDIPKFQYILTAVLETKIDHNLTEGNLYISNDTLHDIK